MTIRPINLFRKYWKQNLLRQLLLPLKLYHLLARKAQSKNFGSYKYRGEWGLLDHLIVSGSLLNSANSFSTSENKATVSNLPFLLTEDKKYGDKEPFRTYKGMKYQGVLAIICQSMSILI